MLDVAPTELLVVVVVAILIIGPKDLPKAMRFVGQWVGRARAIARQFRSGIDAVIREAELQEMEKKWAEENERIMREHPPKSLPDPDAPAKPEAAVPAEAEAPPRDDEPQLPLGAESGPPRLTEKPVINDAANADPKTDDDPR